ncbi:hypothetical protein [Tardiphaga robiniae]|uniref:hypothetical protein n=1 Tax=Tardiphaga robiniae TaxID=943830 RepID=UPI000B34A9D0|nr:hypothetical protein [Tardiphaga robiniae]
MSLRHLIAASVSIALLASFGAAQADTYKPGDYLLLDLQKAVLSPKLLGPPASFEHVQIQAKADAKANVKADPAKAAPRVARAQAAKPVAQRAAAQKKVTHRGNPLNANAADTRVQVWPCRTGGICSWQK